MDNAPRLTPQEDEKMIQDAFDELLAGYLSSNHRKKVRNHRTSLQLCQGGP